MLPALRVESVNERDIDLLLVEELEVSEEFREWIASRVWEEPKYQTKIGAWHSVTDAKLGETDVLYLFGSTGDSRAAVLIEDKIDAPPQPEQATRYRERGSQGENEHMWDEHRTCLLAPRKYLLSAKTAAHHYDSEIAYEEIMSFFLSRRTREERYSYKAEVLRQGILQNRRGYQPSEDPALTRFAREYFEYCSQHHAVLGPEEARPRPALSTWFLFRPEGMIKGYRLAHQTTAGFVKLFFAGAAPHIERIRTRFESLLNDRTEVIPAQKSVALSARVQAIKNPGERPFDEYLDAV